MAFSTGSGRGPAADINVTPLVDVVLVLLIIFMVVTPLLQSQLDADVPKTEVTEATEPPPTDQVVVSLRPDGTLWLNKDQVTEDALRERVTALMRGRSEKIAFLAAADGLEFARIVRVMDICRGSGVDRLGIIDLP